MRFENAVEFLNHNFPAIDPEAPKYAWLQNFLIAFPDDSWEWQAKKTEMKADGFDMSKIGGKWVALAKIGTKAADSFADEIMRDDLAENPIYVSGAATDLQSEIPDDYEARRNYEEDGLGTRGTSDAEQESYRKAEARRRAIGRYGEDEARDVFPELFE